MQVMVESVNQWARWMLGLAQREYWMGVLCFVTHRVYNGFLEEV